jgi:hypothetical protein
LVILGDLGVPDHHKIDYSCRAALREAFRKLLRKSVIHGSRVKRPSGIGPGALALALELPDRR